MKKFLKIGIALMLAILTCAFVLVSCGKDKDDGKNSKGEEVTKRQWRKAFEWWDIDECDVSFTEECSDNDNGYGKTTGTGRFENGIYSYSFKSVWKYNGRLIENEYSDEDEYDEGFYIGVISDDPIDDIFVGLLEDYDDFGFSKFTYDEKTGAYVGTVKGYVYDNIYYVVDASVWFNGDGYITKLVLNIEGIDSDGYSETMDCTYNISNIK